MKSNLLLQLQLLFTNWMHHILHLFTNYSGVQLVQLIQETAYIIGARGATAQWTDGQSAHYSADNPARRERTARAARHKHTNGLNLLIFLCKHLIYQTVTHFLPGIIKL